MMQYGGLVVLRLMMEAEDAGGISRCSSRLPTPQKGVFFWNPNINV